MSKQIGVPANLISRFAATALLLLIVLNARGQTQNPIVIENQNPGNSSWRPLQNGLAYSSETQGIQGYASAPSVNKGGNITFFIETQPANTYSIDIYRMGYYQGTGGRLMQSVGSLQGIVQPACSMDVLPPTGTGLIECSWTASYTLAVPTTWTSGIYLAHLIDAPYENYIIFCVRDDTRQAALLYQQPVGTYQAYNTWGGRSLYTSETGVAATKVSFDRPYSTGYAAFETYGSTPGFESHFVHWLERSGYDVTYTTSVDVNDNGSALLQYKGVIIAGHDEYWSKPVFDAAQAARDAGVNLAFMGANTAYWQIRYEASSSGVPDRVVVCYRDANADPNPDPTLKTINWRDLGRPEQQLIGIQYGLFNDWTANTAYVVSDSSNWVFGDSSGFVDGSKVPRIVGQEVDYVDANYLLPVNLTHTVLSLSNFVAADTSSWFAQSSIYQAPSGAWVFATGTLSWTWVLENWTAPNGYKYTANAGIQEATENVFDQFVASPLPLPEFSIYTVDSRGYVYFYKDDARNGSAQFDSASGNVINSGWSFKQVIAGGNGVIYAVDPSGNLHYYRDLARNGTPNWDPASGNIIATNWNFAQIFSGGNGVIYTQDKAGNLYFFKDLAQNGTSNWAPRSGNVIRTGFNYKKAFGGGNGVIYAVGGAGNLLFFKDLAQNGTSSWSGRSGSVIGNGWGSFTQLFSGGNGIIYAMGSDGTLYFAKDLARNGQRVWASNNALPIASGWVFSFELGDL